MRRPDPVQHVALAQVEPVKEPQRYDQRQAEQQRIGTEQIDQQLDGAQTQHQARSAQCGAGFVARLESQSARLAPEDSFDAGDPKQRDAYGRAASGAAIVRRSFSVALMIRKI